MSEMAEDFLRPTSSRFYPLLVTDVAKETRDAVVVTLAPAPDCTEGFEFTQGQYLTFRRTFDGEEIRRSYSICAGHNEGVLRVGIKRVEGGYFSSWANEELKVGDVVEAMVPMGTFHTPLDAGARRHYLMVAAGSGITPVLSLIKTTLAAEPNATLTVLYGNRSISSIMFREVLEDLKNEYLGRLSIMHVLKRDAQDLELFSGRIDAQKCETLFASLIDASSIDMAFICGPEPMMLTVAAALKAHGVPENAIKFELFASAQPGKVRPVIKSDTSGAKDICDAAITLDGTRRRIDISKGTQSVLDAALAADIEAPYACKAGVCSTCRAKLLDGEVDMAANFALEDYELQRGYILTCQAYPITDTVEIDYDQ
jgi:ring-1,2-phenylacetyl-CoA epoxidase subunit PaaE